MFSSYSAQHPTGDQVTGLIPVGDSESFSYNFVYIATVTCSML